MPAARHALVAASSRANSTPRRKTSASTGAARYRGSISGGRIGSAETSVTRARAQALVGDGHPDVILQVIADPGAVSDDADPAAPQLIGGPHAREHQELR